MQFVFFKCANGETIGYFKSDYSLQGISYSKTNHWALIWNKLWFFLHFYKCFHCYTTLTQSVGYSLITYKNNKPKNQSKSSKSRFMLLFLRTNKKTLLHKCWHYRSKSLYLQCDWLIFACICMSNDLAVYAQYALAEWYGIKTILIDCFYFKLPCFGSLT